MVPLMSTEQVPVGTKENAFIAEEEVRSGGASYRIRDFLSTPVLQRPQ